MSVIDSIRLGKLASFLSRTPQHTDELPTLSVLNGDPSQPLAHGNIIRIRGVLRSVQYSSGQGSCQLTAELVAHVATLKLVWIGRRSITGIDPGREMVIEGRVHSDHRGHAIFNPTYTLLELS